MAQHIVPIMMMEEEDSGYSDSGSEELSPQAVYNNRHDSYFPPYQTLNGDIDSPNDMQVDSEEFLNGNENEKNEDEVAEISPDEGPQADDCTYLPYGSGAVLISASRGYEGIGLDSPHRTASDHRRRGKYMAYRKLVKSATEASWSNL